MALTADQLNTIYQNVLFRPVDTAGIQFFANRSDISDAAIRQQIELSPEASTFVSPIVRLYQEVLGRVPDTAGLKFFSTQLRAGQSLDNIAQQLINSSEFQAKSTATSGAVDATDLSNTNQLVSDAFQSILGRAPAASEFQFFTGKSAAQILSAVAGSSEAANTNAAAVVTFLDSAAVGSPNGGTLNNQTGAGGTNSGTTFNLTTGTDTIAGTAGNDTINAVVDGTAPTLTAADTINGGAGTLDILNVTVAGNNALTPTNGALISNVEGVQIRNISAVGGAGLTTLDASTTPGVTFVNANLSVGNVAVTNATNGLAIGVVGNGTVVNGAVSATYLAAATTANLTIANGTVSAATSDVAIVGNGLTTLNINSVGAANKIDVVTAANSVGGTSTIGTVNINAATNLQFAASSAAGTVGLDGLAANATINVSGAATSVNLGTLTANVGTLNAAGLTAGGVTTTLNTGITSFTGGAGNDTVTTAATTATGAAISGGGGTADRLILAATNDVTTAAKAGQYTNFEILQNQTTGTVDASLFTGVTSLETANAGAGFRGLTAAQAAAVTNLVDNTGATFALTTDTGTTDVLTVTLKNSTSTASADLTNVTVNGFETLNVVSSSGNSADINALSFTAANSLTALNLSGSAPISVNTGGLTSKAITIDASALSFVPASGAFDLTIAGNLLKGSVVTGSAQADSITTTAAITGTTGDFVTYNAGAGDDQISTTLAALNNTSAGNGSVKIDGGAGTDTLTITGATTGIADANFQYVTGIEKLVFAATGALNFQSGANFSTNFGTSGVTITDANLSDTGGNSTLDLGTFTGNATVALTTAATTANTTVVTGSGLDTVTVNAAAATSGNISVSTGAGNDTINVVTNTTGTLTTGTVTVNGGLGQDTINLTLDPAKASLFTVVTNDGHSTVAAPDSISGFVLDTGAARGVTLDFDGTATVAATTANQAVSGYTASQLTYSITNGLLTLSGTSASSITAAQEAAIAQQVVTTANATVAFVNNGDTYVFHDQGSNDSLVKLVGVTATAGVETGGAAANYVHIA